MKANHLLLEKLLEIIDIDKFYNLDITSFSIEFQGEFSSCLVSIFTNKGFKFEISSLGYLKAKMKVSELLKTEDYGEQGDVMVVITLT
jgi:hypothetical protein